MIALDSIIGGVHPVGLAVRLWLFSVVYLGIARMVLLSVRRQAVRSEALRHPDADRRRRRRRRAPGQAPARETALRPASGRLPRRRPAAAAPTRPSLPFLSVGGPVSTCRRPSTRTGARHVILAFSSEPDQVLVGKVRQCQRARGRGLARSPPVSRRSTSARRSTTSAVCRSVDCARPTRGDWQFAIKHAIDRSFALLALLAALPR